MSSSLNLSGLIAAPFTPMLADGSLNLAVIPAYADHLARSGVSGAFVCGTTGEGASLTTAERRQVAAAWCAARRPGLPIIVHVGHNAGRESGELARHAQAIEADAIATIAPNFFRPAALTDLIDWCQPIAAAAPRLPFYYYHMPAMAGADFPMSEFLGSAARCIPNFAGVKFTHENLLDFTRTLAAASGRYDVLAGRDEILLAFLALGAKAAVGSTYNYAAPIYLRLIESFQAGDLAAARQWQARAQALIGAMAQSGGMAANKAIMSLATAIDCGPVRAPLRNLDRSQINLLRRSLETSAFFSSLAEAVRPPAA